MHFQQQMEEFRNRKRITIIKTGTCYIFKDTCTIPKNDFYTGGLVAPYVWLHHNDAIEIA